MFVVLSLFGLSSLFWIVRAADETSSKESVCCKAGDTTPPVELVKQVPNGQLHSPYQDYRSWPRMTRISSSKFRLPGCNECHGGNGGGGICPALTDGARTNAAHG